MQTEIEAKFLNVNHAEIRTKLEALGAHNVQPLRLMKRQNYDFPDGRLDAKNGWVRVRDEGNKVTMSYKQLDDRTITGTYEATVIVDSVESADAFLTAIGMLQKATEESRRESWTLNGVEVELDEWPWAKPFIEIEGKNQESVEQVAGLLGLDIAAAVYGSVEIVYMAEYDITEKEAQPPKITFDHAPEWVHTKRK